MLTPFPQIFENINKSQFIFYVECLKGIRVILVILVIL